MKDLFSDHSNAYAKYRPGYPPELIEIICSVCENHNKVWDCATGNGQMALLLAPYFKHVLASDISKNQIAVAPSIHNITYSVQPAENTNYPDRSFDLVVVAQAIHWFDFDAFWKEVKRVLKPGGIVALTGYGLASINERIDQVVYQLYQPILSAYWPPERAHIENEYASIPFPFERVDVPELVNKKQWPLDHFLGYLRTWSAAKRYQQDLGHDPIELIREDLEQLWDTKTVVSFPLLLKIGRNL
ncbi:MAG: class I SAM-dependent methyltransferase [Marinoscillum sp.]